MEIRPGRHFRRQYLLDGPFVLNAPGIYPVRASHKVAIYAEGTGFRVVASQKIVSKFTVTLVKGSEEQLESAYAPILRDLKSSDALTSSLARSAVVQDPPSFLQSVILSMADNPKTAAASVSGLKHLATPQAKAKLAQLCGVGRPEYIRQMAIPALADLGDSKYCSTMLDVARESHEYSRFIALRAAGYLCGARALPLIRSQLDNSNPSHRYEAAYALGNSHSRKAVSLLIPLLLDPNANVRDAARNSLATLTHRRSKRKRSVQKTQRNWMSWWVSHKTTAPIYGINACSESRPLP